MMNATQHWWSFELDSSLYNDVHYNLAALKRRILLIHDVWTGPCGTKRSRIRLLLCRWLRKTDVLQRHSHGQQRRHNFHSRCLLDVGYHEAYQATAEACYGQMGLQIMTLESDDHHVMVHRWSPIIHLSVLIINHLSILIIKYLLIHHKLTMNCCWLAVEWCVWTMG